MAPLTRNRGTDHFSPGSSACEYYSQRATEGGLIITEATCISPETPYEYAPGIYTKEQEGEWKKIVDAVHQKKGLICMYVYNPRSKKETNVKIIRQLWHLGRAAHGSWANNPFLKSLNRGLPNVSASAVAVPEGQGKYKEGGGERNNVC